ncbi:methyltransferase domain-containing protein [Pedobacter sp.]|uniref:class I SAM-dependent methyltransferase n=1 Tax=Pedobacter sp. TaxID=1411316 RepID=UPI0031DAFEB5
MKYLNLGCGHNFSTNKIWTNLDFVVTEEGVIAHNLLAGVPFEDESFNLVYHSHVLEHFSRKDGKKFLQECFRVLAKAGVIRIAIPDLERIAETYLKMLKLGIANEDDDVIRANYNWMMLEMYDQTVRNYGGGEMADYLFQEEIINEDFVYERIGEEGKEIRNYYLNQSKDKKPFKRTLNYLFRMAIHRFKSLINNKEKTTAMQIGQFRLQGEIHQWMYDRYSLSHLLKEIGFKDCKIQTAFTSYIPEWNTFNLDGKDNTMRKPDSLYIEAIK